MRMGTQLQLDQIRADVSMNMNNKPATIPTGRRRNNLLLLTIQIDIKRLHSPAINNNLTRHALPVKGKNNFAFTLNESGRWLKAIEYGFFLLGVIPNNVLYRSK